MNVQINTKTGNKIVDKIGQMNFQGNVIPETWYSTVVNSKGNVNCLAIIILADIVYWYRPSEIRSESGLLVNYKKKFNDDFYLQRNYEQISEKFNISKKQARDSIVFLEELGVIKRHFRTIDCMNGKLPNVMFIELIPEILQKLTYPDRKEGIYKNVDTCVQTDREVLPQNEIHVSKNIDTNTENTSEITTKIISTTADKKFEKHKDTTDGDFVVVKKLLEPFGIDEKGVNAILKAASYDIRKCKAAVNMLKAQKSPISNVTGWIIKAIRDEYQLTSYGGVVDKSGYMSGSVRASEEHEELRLLEQLYLAQVPRSDSIA